MSTITEPLQQTRGLTIENYRASLGEELGAVIDDALAANPTKSAYDFGRKLRAENDIIGDEISADQANSVYGKYGLIFDKPVSLQYAQGLADNKRESAERQALIERGPRGLLPGLAKLGAQFGAGAIDPVNIVSAFVPVVGEARFAAMAGRMGTTGARLATGAIEGLVGAGMVEPLNYLGAYSRQDAYGAADALANLAFGTVLGGGLHLAAGAVRDGWAALKLGDMAATGNPPRPATLAEAIDNLPSDAKADAMRVAVAQMDSDFPVNVSQFLDDHFSRLDPERGNVKWVSDKNGGIMPVVDTVEMYRMPNGRIGRPVTLKDIEALSSGELTSQNQGLVSVLDAMRGKTEKAPETLTQFLRKLGGIKEQAGELAAMDARKAMKGLVNNKRGLTLDKAREAAVEAGYIRDTGAARADMEAQSTTNDLLDAIDRELRGEPVYRDADLSRAMSKDDMAKAVADTEQFFHENEIDIAGKTNEEIVKELIDKKLLSDPLEARFYDNAAIVAENYDDLHSRIDAMPDDPLDNMQDLEEALALEIKNGTISDDDLAILTEADDLVKSADAAERGVFAAASCIYRKM